MKNLTKKERLIYYWILGYLSKHEYKPSLKEIKDAVGINTEPQISQYIVKLRKKGALSWWY